MKFTLKNLLLFIALYVSIIFITNLFICFLYESFFPIPYGGYEYVYLKLPFPTVGRYCAVLPPEQLSKFALRINYLGVLLDTLLLISSIHLVFTRKVRPYFWVILFALLNFLTITYFFVLERPHLGRFLYRSVASIISNWRN